MQRGNQTKEPPAGTQGNDYSYISNGSDKGKDIMKRNSIALALIAAGVLASGVAAAADTHTVNVNAVVAGTCKFMAAGPTTVNVQNNVGGNIDPSLTGAGNATGSATINFRCTKGATSSMNVGASLYAGPVGRTVTSGANTMTYTMTLTGYAQAGQGFGAGGVDLPLVVAADITEAVWSVAAAGTYTDSMVLTVNP